jgi:DHA1 family bicyclomycin/chloramphenicol resistance-like MFS transporter
MKPFPSPMPPVSERRLAIVGAAMVALGPVSLAVYTPAMPEIARAFATTPAAVNMTLTAFFGGFACAQLVCGPLSDAFGRKPVGLVFFSIYIAASLAAAFAPSIETLIAARLLQGIGAAAGIALSRAMVRDLFTGQNSARIMGLIGIMLAVGPAVSPALGGLALYFAGWHAIFAVMLAYGLALLAVLRLAIPETLAVRDPAKLRPARLLGNYASLLGDASFMRPSLLIGLTVGGLYGLALMMPFVMIDRIGLTPLVYGLTMLAQTAAYTLGGVVAQRLMRRLPADRLVPIGIGLVAVAGVAVVADIRLLELSVPAVLAPVMLWAFGIALVIPACQTAALADVPHIAGAAAALMGFIQMAAGFVAGIAAAQFVDQVTAISVILPAMAGLALLVYFGPGRRATPA